MVLFEPLGLSLRHYWRVPFSGFSEAYLLNAWLFLDFLYDSKCVTNPEEVSRAKIAELIAEHGSPYLYK
jgi:hypothetical protein